MLEGLIRLNYAASRGTINSAYIYLRGKVGEGQVGIYFI